jgi:hypothetical protein
VSSNHTAQYQQYTSTISINHALVRRLSVVVAAILIFSVVLNFIFIPIRFIVYSPGFGWAGVEVVNIFMLMDMCAHFTAVCVTNLIMNKEVAGIYDTAAPEIRPRDWKATGGLGFWLLICAAVCRPLYWLLSAPLLCCTSPWAHAREQQTQDWKPSPAIDSSYGNSQPNAPPNLLSPSLYHNGILAQPCNGTPAGNQRSPTIGIHMVAVAASTDEQTPEELTPVDTTDFDAETRRELVDKMESSIEMLQAAVHAYPKNNIIDNGCKSLLDQVKANPDFAWQLANRLAGHFNRQSAALFLGMPPGLSTRTTTPGPLLWQDDLCTERHFERPTIQPSDRRRGVYLIVLRPCCHDISSSTSNKELRYVGSGRSARGGVMLRVREHTKYEVDYRNGANHGLKPKLYDEWNKLEPACAAIYLLAEWDELPPYANPGLADDFDDILLAEAIWQVVLQTAVRDENRMSEFTQFLKGQLPEDERLVNEYWEGCNVNSALEKSWREIREDAENSHVH